MKSLQAKGIFTKKATESQPLFYGLNLKLNISQNSRKVVFVLS